jgi:uncharacterized surface protein with fasciclin (FAS1) repeats
LCACAATAIAIEVPAQNVNIESTEPDTGTIRRSGEKSLAETQDLWNTSKTAGNLDTFVDAIDAAGLENQLSAPGRFTIFAPSDGAFAKLGKDALDNLLHPDRRPELRKLLLNHIAKGELQLRENGTTTVHTLSGKVLRVRHELRGFVIDNAVIEKDGVVASNGLIHIIDRVLSR